MHLFISGSGLLLNIPPGYRQVGRCKARYSAEFSPNIRASQPQIQKSQSCLCNHRKAMRENFASTNGAQTETRRGQRIGNNLRKHPQIRLPNAIVLPIAFGHYIKNVAARQKAFQRKCQTPGTLEHLNVKHAWRIDRVRF
jgi:hypothetical protein